MTDTDYTALIAELLDDNDLDWNALEARKGLASALSSLQAERDAAERAFQRSEAQAKRDAPIWNDRLTQAAKLQHATTLDAIDQSDRAEKAEADLAALRRRLQDLSEGDTE